MKVFKDTSSMKIFTKNHCRQNDLSKVMFIDVFKLILKIYPVKSNIGSYFTVRSYILQ